MWRPETGAKATFSRRSRMSSTELLDAASISMTSSDVASLPEPRRGRLLERIGELAADLPETLELAERSDVQLWFRDGAGG